MESKHYFKIYYAGRFIESILAETKWEAIDRAYHKYLGLHQNVVRGQLKANKVR
jgi:hypothetical protein